MAEELLGVREVQYVGFLGGGGGDVNGDVVGGV